MGFLDRKKRGMDCQPNEDKSFTCRPYEIKDGEKLATGSEVTISADPNNGCKPAFTGRMDMLDEDEDAINHVAGKVVSSCKKGL